MSTSPSELRSALAQQVTVTDDALVVDLVDGRTVSVPLPWYPRLAQLPRFWERGAEISATCVGM